PPVSRIRLSSTRGRWILAAAVLGSAVPMLTGTVVNVALPAIGEGLAAGTSELQWVLNGYLLAVASLILVGGSLGDRFGRRRIFVIGAVAFAATTLVCAVAPTVEWLVSFRVLQGVSAALLTPGSLSILEAVLHPDDRGRAIGAWSALGGIAAAVGPVLGGWLVDVGSWRWVFFLTLPPAAGVVFVALRCVPETRDPEQARLDFAGAGTAFLGLAGLTWALVVGPERGFTEPGVLGPGVVGALLLALFLVIEARSSEPMVPLRMFADRQFAAANAVTFVIYGALGGVFFLLVVHLQVALGYRAVTAGASMLPVTALMLLLSSAAGDWAQRRGARNPLTLGGVLIAGGMLLMARIDPGDGYVEAVLPAVVLFGLGLACTVAPVTSAALAAADPRRTGVASGINNAVSRTAQLIAVAVVPWIAGLQGGEINDAEAMARGFPVAMTTVAGVALAGALLAFLTVSDRPLGDPERAERSCRHCAIDATPLRVEQDAAARSM
ncbi:MAG: DHA2 family efflux MFS transporter permease subunit, partial [Gemmatimonadota bacterium]|nr:DHA2 family efflux MFS transporter permease subunit [Gemmatimonadota bacterium]